MDKIIKIGGAGIAGLTAAINLAKAGFRVQVFDAARDSGQRFNGDFQGIENWSYRQDALSFLKDINLEPNFDYQGFAKVSAWAPGFHRDFEFSRPVYYLVKRGIESGCLDQGLKNQALALGAEIIYNHPVRPEQVDIVATGPILHDPTIDAAAAGYTFETDAEDCGIAILDDNYAPDGYGYFLVRQKRGTIATCMTRNFSKLNRYLEKTLELCRQNKKFKMENVRKFAGTANLFLARIPADKKPYAGEAGGFQDGLWGFGIKYAMKSGYYAARSIIENKDFYSLCQKDLFPRMKASVVNRWLFALLGNRAFKWLVADYAKRIKNPLKLFHTTYNYSFLAKLFFPLAAWLYRKNLKDPRPV